MEGCEGLYKVRAGSLQGASFHLWCLEGFPSFSPSFLTRVLQFHLVSQSGDTTGARSVSDRLPKNSRWNTEDCEGWYKLPAQLPSIFLCLSLALFLPFSTCIQIHSQFWLLSWYLVVTVLHTGAPNQFLLHKYISLSIPSVHDPFISFSACCQTHSLSPSCSKQLLGLTQNCTYPSPPNRHNLMLWASPPASDPSLSFSPLLPFTLSLLCADERLLSRGKKTLVCAWNTRDVLKNHWAKPSSLSRGNGMSSHFLK